MDYRIIFSDVDGTLLSSSHKVLPGTKEALTALRRRGIPFAIVTARSPSGIRSVLRDLGFPCPLICYSGALILDEAGRVLASRGFTREQAADMIRFIENKALPCTWNLFSLDNWIVSSRSDPRVAREESIVQAQAQEGSAADIPADAPVGKILCMCAPGSLRDVQDALSRAYPEASIVPSSDALLEIMAPGIGKGSAVRALCALWDIPVRCAVAFGDHFNDLEMLQAVGCPVAMGNAPAELKKTARLVTRDNDNEGIACALKTLGIL